MTSSPWLTIVGLGEDGPDGLTPASHKALAEAEAVLGPARHLALLPDLGCEVIEWPMPFADGFAILEQLRGKSTVALVSGNPFWFGAGTVIADHFEAEEWQALPAPSTFSYGAAHLGWALESTVCAGLHAVPFERLRPNLAPGVRAIVTLRDGSAVGEFAQWLVGQGFGATTLHIMEAMGGPNQRVRRCIAADVELDDVAHPVALAIEIAGQGPALPLTAGKPDDFFKHDGQITKRPVRALTVSTLAPRPGETLWDLGAGSGSIAIEWLMTHASTQAVAVEVNPDRADVIRHNAGALGQDRLQVITGQALDCIGDLTVPDAVFIGGGLSSELLDALWSICPVGTRVVVNTVTLETEALVLDAQRRLGGELMRVEIAQPAPIGRYTGWKAAYPLVQWSVTR